MLACYLLGVVGLNVYGCIRECDLVSMADMVSYGDRVYCVACCDKWHQVGFLFTQLSR